MAVPDGLLIAGAVVGLVGGVVGVATGADNIVTRVKRARAAKRDAAMVLHVEFGRVDRFNGPVERSFPVAAGRLFNNGKVTAKDIQVTSSTGFVLIEATNLAPDESTPLAVAVTGVHLPNLEPGLPVPVDHDSDWWPDETPYVVGKVVVSVTWRVDGTSERSKPLAFEADYTRPPLA